MLFMEILTQIVLIGVQSSGTRTVNLNASSTDKEHYYLHHLTNWIPESNDNYLS